MPSEPSLADWRGFESISRLRQHFFFYCYYYCSLECFWSYWCPWRRHCLPATRSLHRLSHRHQEPSCHLFLQNQRFDRFGSINFRKPLLDHQYSRASKALPEVRQPGPTCSRRRTIRDFKAYANRCGHLNFAPSVFKQELSFCFGGFPTI